MNEKTKFALYLDQETKKDLAEYYCIDGSRSQTEFAEKAVKFYLDYNMVSNCGDYLPTEVKSCMDGRLATFENRMASLLFKMAVEHEMIMRILAEELDLDNDTIQTYRGKSVQSVKRTNGRLKFEDVAEQEETDWQN